MISAIINILINIIISLIIIFGLIDNITVGSATLKSIRNENIIINLIISFGTTGFVQILIEIIKNLK